MSAFQRHADIAAGLLGVPAEERGAAWHLEADGALKRFAAAPDLLAALQQIDALRASSGKSDAEMLFEMRSISKAAIAKALGA